MATQWPHLMHIFAFGSVGPSAVIAMIDDGHTCEQALHLVQLAATVNVKSGVGIILFLDKGKKWNLFC